MKVVILGGGPCGLTAAWELSKRGIPVTVVEKDSCVGGLCRTIRKSGYQFDLGGHRFISKDNELVEDISHLLGERLLTRIRKSVIRFKEREYDYPLNLSNVLSRSGFAMGFKFAVGYLASSLKRGGCQESFDGWITQRFGAPLNEFFFRPYTEKLWGIKASQLSSDWAAQRISLPNLKDAVLKSTGFFGKKPRTYAVEYLYPKGGIGEIFETMKEDIERLGGKVITGFSPRRFEASGTTMNAVIVENESGESLSISADHFLSTIPVDTLSKIVSGKTLPTLPYRSLRFLNITLSGIENISPNTWMYTPDPDVIMTRVQEPKRRSPHSAPNGQTSVMLEIPCDKGDDIWNMADEKLLEVALGSMNEIGFSIKENVTGVFSTFAEYAYPRYELGYSEKVKEHLACTKGYSNLDSLGRQGLFRYIFMDTAMLMGRHWARKLLNDDSLLKIEDMDSEPTLLETQSVVT